MPEFASPMLRRWQLGNALRQLREDRGMTIADVTAAMKERYGSSFSDAKLSRMETAKRGVIPRDVHDLCLLYEIPPDRLEDMVNLAKSARGPEIPVGDDHTRDYLWFAALEQVTTSIREYSLMIIPGLLQTAAYARVVENLQHLAPDYYQTNLEGVSVNAADRVEMRLNRQQVLKREQPPALHALIDENALRRRMPDSAIMLEQIGQLIQLSKRPHIVVQVLPLTAGIYPGSEGIYWSILDFPRGDNQPPQTLYTETTTGIRITDRESEITRMANAFRTMTGLALSPDESREYMEQIRNWHGGANWPPQQMRESPRD
jgi:transcriptional regulator with XRE-family HTH domain